METTLRQIPSFLRKSELFKHLTEDDHNLDEVITVPIIVTDKTINGIKDFENILIVEDFWGTYVHIFSIYLYSFENRNEVIEFLRPLRENFFIKKLFEEIVSGLFIVNNKNQLLGYIKEKYPQDQRMHQELIETNIFLFAGNFKFSFDSDIILYSNNVKLLTLEGNLYIDDDYNIMHENFFSPLKIKRSIEENFNLEMIIRVGDDMIFNKYGDFMVIDFNHTDRIEFKITRFNIIYILESLQRLHDLMLDETLKELYSDNFEMSQEDRNIIKNVLLNPNTYF